jgi:hypothetical protein
LTDDESSNNTNNPFASSPRFVFGDTEEKDNDSNGDEDEDEEKNTQSEEEKDKKNENERSDDHNDFSPELVTSGVEIFTFSEYKKRESPNNDKENNK